MKTLSASIFLILLFSLAANSQSNSEDHSINSAILMNKYFPFELREIDGHYLIVAQLEGPDLYPQYYKLFEKYGYEGNGPCWEGHIKQILQKIDKNLIKHISYDTEAGGFFATADTKANQIRFVKLLSPIFYDLKKLEVWIKKADYSKIDD